MQLFGSLEKSSAHLKLCRGQIDAKKVTFASCSKQLVKLSTMSSQYRNPRKEFLKRPLLQDHGHPLLESLLTLPNKGSNGLFKELSVVDVEPPASLLASVLTGQTSFKSSTECEPRPAKVLRTLSSSSNDIEMFEQNSTASGMSTWTPNLDPIGYHGKRRPLCARCRNHGRRIILRGMYTVHLSSTNVLIIV